MSSWVCPTGKKLSQTYIFKENKKQSHVSGFGLNGCAIEGSHHGSEKKESEKHLMFHAAAEGIL